MGTSILSLIESICFELALWKITIRDLVFKSCHLDMVLLLSFSLCARLLELCEKLADRTQSLTSDLFTSNGNVQEVLHTVSCMPISS